MNSLLHLEMLHSFVQSIYIRKYPPHTIHFTCGCCVFEELLKAQKGKKIENRCAFHLIATTFNHISMLIEMQSKFPFSIWSTTALITIEIHLHICACLCAVFSLLHQNKTGMFCMYTVSVSDISVDFFYFQPKKRSNILDLKS